VRRGAEQLAVRTEGHAVDGVRQLERPYEVIGFGVVHTHRLVDAAGGEQLAVRAGGDATYLAGVAQSLGELVTAGHFPELDGAILLAGGDGLAIRTKVDVRGALRMTLQRPHPLAGFAVP